MVAAHVVLVLHEQLLLVLLLHQQLLLVLVVLLLLLHQLVLQHLISVLLNVEALILRQAEPIDFPIELFHHILDAVNQTFLFQCRNTLEKATKSHVRIRSSLMHCAHSSQTEVQDSLL